MHGHGLKALTYTSFFIASLMLVPGCLIQADSKTVEVIYPDSVDITLSGSSPSDTSLNYFITDPLFPRPGQNPPELYGLTAPREGPVVTYKPNENDGCPRIDSFYFTATDGVSESLPAKVTVNIKCSDNYKYIFITSQPYSGNMGGLSGADDICKTHADNSDQSDLHNKAWRAWLSLPGTENEVKNRLHSEFSGDGGYILSNSVQVAGSWQDLIMNGARSKVNRDENGNEVLLFNDSNQSKSNGYVWTATDQGGSYREPANVTEPPCNNWESESGAPARLGVPNLTGAPWTTNAILGACNERYRLYCVQQ